MQSDDDMKRRLTIAVLAVLFFVAALLGVTLVPKRMLPVTILTRLEVFTCRNSHTEAEKEICYQKHVPKLIDEGVSMETTFAVLAAILRIDPGYQSCHVAAHLISGREVAKDPTQWKTVLLRVPTNICGSGALHGAFQERFKVESMPDVTTAQLRDLLDGVCDAQGGWNPPMLDRSSCMHGMGHMFLYITNADVKRSVALCDALGRKADFDFRQTCTEGVFMQVYQPIDQEDENLVRNLFAASRDTVSFCAPYKGMAHLSCVKETWPAVENSATDPEIFTSLCRQLKDPADARYCAGGLMYPVIEMLHYDIPTIERFCEGLQDQEFRNICWARTASKMVWADWSQSDKAVAICNSAPSGAQQDCWNELINFASGGLPKGSRETRALCGGMPDPYRTACVAATDTRV